MSFQKMKSVSFILLLLLLIGCQPQNVVEDPAPQWDWEPADAGLPRQAIVATVAIDPNQPDRLWAGYYDTAGLATSRDGGQTWTFGGDGLGHNPVFDLLALSSSASPETASTEGDQTILWAAVREGVLYSLDGGTS
ncbi:MAG: hypothetical protein AAF485_03855 [Chloroflexota bacterium]